MSRVDILDRIFHRKDINKNALEFDWNKLWVPPIMSLFSVDDINELIRIATSIRYNGNIEKKYSLIDSVMKKRGFLKTHCGTNRVVYKFLENPLFVAKVAVDKVGMTDSPAEFMNQRFLQPFCCKIFEVHPSGVIAFVERVNPISSLEEFMSISDNVFNMLVIKIMGKYVFDDLGTRSYMNFGVRDNSLGCTFGPVVIDFPYVYELDGAKLYCRNEVVNPYTGQKEICNGEIDYKAGFNGLECTKCHREYTAKELSKDDSNIYFEWSEDDSNRIKHMIHMFRAKVVSGSKVLLDSGRSSRTYISKEDYLAMGKYDIPYSGEFEVIQTNHVRHKSIQVVRQEQGDLLVKQYYENLNNYRYKEATKIKNILHVDEEEEQYIEVVDEVPYRSNIPFLDNPISEPSKPSVAKPVQVKPTQELLEQLEDQTFPEIKVTQKLETNPTSDIVIKPQSNVTNIAVQSSEDVIPTQVYSDEQMEQFIAENISRLEDKPEDNPDSDIIDSSQTPEVNPINRPYPTADSEIYAGNKQQPRVDTSKVSKVQYTPKLEDVDSYLPPEKLIGRDRYNNKKKHKNSY